MSQLIILVIRTLLSFFSGPLFIAGNSISSLVAAMWKGLVKDHLVSVNSVVAVFQYLLCCIKHKIATGESTQLGFLILNAAMLLVYKQEVMQLKLISELCSVTLFPELSSQVMIWLLKLESRQPLPMRHSASSESESLLNPSEIDKNFWIHLQYLFQMFSQLVQFLQLRSLPHQQLYLQL